MNRFIRGLRSTVPGQEGSVVTIGSFDGIHRGHAAVLSRLKQKAAEYNLPSLVVIFEPHPKEFFSGGQAPARLFRTREKVETLFQQGVDRVCCLRFGRKLRNLSAEEFIRKVLVDGLKTKFLTVGDDFRFGCSREGDYRTLQRAGREYGFEVADNETVEHNGRRISSTWIRQALGEADFQLAAVLLGRPYCISGRVVHGQHLGKKLGFPTANIRLHRYRAPLEGVYIVVMEIEHGGAWRRLPGVANVGVRPTLGDPAKPVLEVHLLDFDQQIYGKRVKIEFLEKVREEKKFDSLGALRAAVEQDVIAAGAYFDKAGARAGRKAVTGIKNE